MEGPSEPLKAGGGKGGEGRGGEGEETKGWTEVKNLSLFYRKSLLLVAHMEEG